MSTQTRQILVVDDNPSIHDDFRKIFLGFGPDTSQIDQFTAALFGAEPVQQKSTYQLHFASQGQEALEMVRAAIANGKPYSMAFMDVQMPPGWDGIQTMGEIWKIAPDLHVVICTAFSSYSFEEIRNVGRSDQVVVLKKPFDAIEVLQMANVFSEKWQLLNEVKERARKLEESQHRYRFLAEATPGLLWTATAGGNVDYVNQRWIDYTGVTAEKCMDWNWQSAVHPEDLPSCIARWTSALQTGDNFESEYRLRRVDGVYRWHLGRARPMRNEHGDILHWVGTCTDIDDKKSAEATERKRTEEKLHLQTSALEATANGMIICDKSGTILWVNPAFAKLTGYSADEVVGKTPAILKSGTHTPDFYANLWGTVMAGKDWHGELVNRRKDGTTYYEEMTITPVLDDRGGIKNFVAVKQDITGRKRDEAQVHAREEAFRALADNVPDAVSRVDRQFRFAYGNRAFAADIRREPCAFLGKTSAELNLPMQARWHEELSQVFASSTPRTFEFHWEGPEGLCYRESRLVPEFSAGGEVEFVLAVTRDVTKEKLRERERQLMELQLRQAQKMEAVGQLAAGIAHEINTPTQYVGDNTHFLKDAFANLTGVLKGYTVLIAAAKQNAVTPELIAQAEQVVADNDLDYLIEQIPAAINETLEGVDRVSKIVHAMKEFSYPGGKEKGSADLNKAIESTTTVARNEWKYIANMVLELDPDLPTVPCFISEFNQAILNLVVNAAHAICDAIRDQKGQKGTITIRTRRDGDYAEIRVSDTGTGIPEEHRHRIFEPFFTTKDVGKGTGQGLAVVYGSIVKKHGGTVTFETETGKGTTFILRLPLGLRTPANASSLGASGPQEAHVVQAISSP